MATGHLRKRIKKNGAIGYQIIVESEPDQETGKRSRVYKTVYSTKKDADRIMRDTIAEIENQVFIRQSKTTLKEFLKEWLNIYILPHKSPTTVDGYRLNVERYIIPALGNKKLQDLKVIDIQKFYNELHVKSPLSDRPLSGRSIRNIHMNLQAALEKAVDQGIIPKNPAKKVELPKTKKYVADVYTVEEVKKLFEAVKGSTLELAIHILILLGLRRGELLALRWENVDLDNGAVYIVENAVQINSSAQRLIKSPKTESGNRRIEVPPSLIKMLRKGKVTYLESKLRLGRSFTDSGLVVCLPDGRPYGPGYFSQKVHRLLDSKGIRRIRIHDFRHTNATLMLKQGISPKVAQSRLGHSTISVTMDTYTHVLDDMEKEAAYKLDEFLYLDDAISN